MTLRLFAHSLLGLALAVGGAGAPAGCSDCGGNGANTDAGPQNFQLVLLDPPGDSIGLAFGGSVSLRVAYLDAGDQPRIGATVQFRMMSGPTEDPGGSTLSTNSATTDALGIARVDLVAGAEPTNFRVEVSATNAPSAYFYVAVSENGFAELRITPMHQGWRLAESFDDVELRMYRSTDLRCVDLDIDQLPESVFPLRSLPGFTGKVTYQNVSVGAAYTLVAWAELPDSEVRTAAGCVDLGAQQVVVGTMQIAIAVSDRPAALPHSARLTSTIDLTPVAAASAEHDRSWQLLGCPVGSGQLVLECTLDALVPDDALDCVVTGEGAAIDAAEAQRGAPDEYGCRPAMAGDETLDARLDAAVAAGGSWPMDDALGEIVTARLDALSGFFLKSELTFVAAGAARHRLDSLVLTLGGDSFTADLGASDRPVLEQPEVAIAVAERELSIGQHGFTLRYGRAAAAGFRQLALAPAGLEDRADDLGSALFESVHDGDTGSDGCAAVSAILCDAIGELPDCAEAACAGAAIALDTDLSGWWHRLDGPGLDLTLAGDAPLYDDDDDLSIEAIGTDSTDDATGSWTVGFTLSDGTTIETAGDFGSTETVP